MNDFKMVQACVRDVVAETRTDNKCKHYMVCAKPSIYVSVMRPGAFDRYGDVVAEVKLYVDGKVVVHKLLTYETNLERFYRYLKKKIETNIISRKD